MSDSDNDEMFFGDEFEGDDKLDTYNNDESSNSDTSSRYRGGAKLKRKTAPKQGSRVNSSHSSELDKLDKFDKSTHTLEKQTQIRKMAKILSKVLGITGDIDRMSISDIQKKVKSTVPNNPKAWRVQNDKQHELCVTLAHAVNAVAGRDVISTKLPTSEICDKSADFINSLFTGMNSEFITISRDVKERVDAIETLLRLLESGRSKVETAGNKMQVTDPEFKPLLRLMDEVIKELNFQLSHLRNILNVSVMPTETGLMALFERQAVLKNFLDRTQSTQPGSQAYGSRLVSVLNSLELVTSATDLVHNALKDIGMSVAEYKKIATYDELESKLLGHLARISKSSPTYIIFDKFYRAADVLRRNDYRRETISKAIAGGFESTGGYDGGNSKRRKGGDNKMLYNEKDGAVDNEYVVNPSDRMTKLEKTRENIVETYVTKLEGQFDQFFNAVDHLAMKFGSTVKLNKELDLFIDALAELKDLPSLRDDDGDKASSFVKNVLGLENQVYEVGKDLFLSRLERIKTALKAVSGDTKDANTAISSIIGFTDEVYDLIQTTRKIKTFEPTNYSGGRAKKISVFTSDDLNKFISGLRRRVFTARIKENFKMIDTSVFNKEYENMLGKFMAAKKQRFNDSTNKEMKELIKEEDIDKERLKTKVQILLATEAIDLYLGYFSDTLIKNPDDIQDILKLIEPLKQIKSVTEDDTNKDNLKNLVALFIYIGEKFGGVNLRDKSPLSPKLLFKYLSKHFNVTPKDHEHPEKQIRFFHINEELDLLYKLTLQAMIGKILACIEGYSAIYARSGTQTIDRKVRLLVGAGSENITIIDDAFEGYIKIPLLIEFYRSVFYDNIKDIEEKESKNFSVLPKSTSGLISNLIDTIFKLGSDPVYTNEEVKLVILEVNSLYNSCTSNDKFREMLYMVVNDMNFRYSLYDTEVISKYRDDNENKFEEFTKFPHKKNTAAHLLEDNGRLDGEPYMPSSKFYASKGNNNIDNIKNNVISDYELVKEFIIKITNAMDDADIGSHTYFKIDYLTKLFKEKKTKDEKFNFIKKNLQTGSNVEEVAIKKLFIDHYIVTLLDLLESITNLENYNNYQKLLSLISSGLVSYEVSNGSVHWDVSNLIEYVDSLYKLTDKILMHVDKEHVGSKFYKDDDDTTIVEQAKTFKKKKSELTNRLSILLETVITLKTRFSGIQTIVQGTSYFAESDDFIRQMLAVSYNKKLSDISVFDSEGKVTSVKTGGRYKRTKKGGYISGGDGITTNSDKSKGEQRLRQVRSAYSKSNSEYDFKLFNSKVISELYKGDDILGKAHTLNPDIVESAFNNLGKVGNYSLLRTIASNNYKSITNLNDTLSEYFKQTLMKTNPASWIETISKFVEDNVNTCSTALLDEASKKLLSTEIKNDVEKVFLQIVKDCITFLEKLNFNKLNIDSCIKMLEYDAGTYKTIDTTFTNEFGSIKYTFGHNSFITSDMSIDNIDSVCKNILNTYTRMMSSIDTVIMYIMHLELYNLMLENFDTTIMIDTISLPELRRDIIKNLDFFYNNDNKVNLFNEDITKSIDNYNKLLSDCKFNGTNDLINNLNNNVVDEKHTYLYIFGTLGNYNYETLFKCCQRDINSSYLALVALSFISEKQYDFITKLVRDIRNSVLTEGKDTSKTKFDSNVDDITKKYDTLFNEAYSDLDNIKKNAIDSIMMNVKTIYDLKEIVKTLTNFGSNDVVLPIMNKLVNDEIVNQLFEYIKECYNILLTSIEPRFPSTVGVKVIKDKIDNIKKAIGELNETVNVYLDKIDNIAKYNTFLENIKSIVTKLNNPKINTKEYVNDAIKHILYSEKGVISIYSDIISPDKINNVIKFINNGNYLKVCKTNLITHIRSNKYSYKLLKNPGNIMYVIYYNYVYDFKHLYESDNKNAFKRLISMIIDECDDYGKEVASKEFKSTPKPFKNELKIYKDQKKFNNIPYINDNIVSLNTKIDEFIKVLTELKSEYSNTTSLFNTMRANKSNTWNINISGHFSNLLEISSVLVKTKNISIRNSSIETALGPTLNPKYRVFITTKDFGLFTNYYNDIDTNNVLVNKFNNPLKGGARNSTIINLVKLALLEQGVMDDKVIDFVVALSKANEFDATSTHNLLNILQMSNKNTIKDLYDHLTGVLDISIKSNVYDVSLPTQKIDDKSKDIVISVLAWFNSFLYSYISDVFDKNSEVVYGKLLMDFANSASDAVYNGKGFSRTTRSESVDTTRTMEAESYDYTIRDPIDVRTALVLRRIMREKDAKGIMSRWLVQNAADMTSYYKDRLRMVLPYYQTHLNIFSEHCTLLRETIIEYSKGNDIRNNDGLVKEEYISLNILKQQEHTDYPEVKYFMPDTKEPKENQLQWEYFPAVLTKFENYAKTLKLGITNTLRDLDDSVVVGNTYYDSINDYVNINGMEPLVLMLQDGITTNILNPNSPYRSVPTSNEFKYLYMFKSLGYEKYDLSRTHQILNLFNSVNSTAISKELFEDVSRALYLGMNITAIHNQIPTISNLDKTIYSVNSELDKLIKLRETSNQIKTLTRDSNKANGRKDIIKTTVAELNINPVNLKALTRNIPLANIYRYADLASLYNNYKKGEEDLSNSFDDPTNKLYEVLKNLRRIIKNALTAQETSDTREGLMAIYED